MEPAGGKGGQKRERLAGSNKSLTSQFLAHADPGTARFHTEQDPRTLPTDDLDKAIDKLGEMDGLEHAEENIPAND